MKKLKAFTMVEITIAIAIIITISYLSMPLLQKQRMIDDTRNLVSEITNIINNDLRDPFYGYIKENTNTLVSTTTNGVCKTDPNTPPCSGNLTYTCISANRVATCTQKSYLFDFIYDNSFSKITPNGAYNPNTYIKLKSLPNTAYIKLEQNNPNNFKFRLLLRGDIFSSNEKNMVLTMVKSKLFSEIGVFNSFVESTLGETMCDKDNSTCYIEFILR